MPWIMASAMMLALYDIAKKASVRANAVLPVLLASTMFGFAVYTIGLIAYGQVGAIAGISGPNQKGQVWGAGGAGGSDLIATVNCHSSGSL